MLHKKSLITLILIYCVGTLLLGCVTTQPPNARTEFLKSYHVFKPNPNASDAWISTTPHFNLDRFKHYQKIAIAPVSLWLEQGQAFQIQDKAKQQQMKQYLEQAIRQQLHSSKQLVPMGTKDALQVNLAITYLGERSPELEPLDILPFRMVINSGELAYLTATKQKKSIGQASLEIAFTDTNTGENLAAAIVKSEYDERYVDDQPDNIEAIKPILDSWAKRLLKALSSISQD